MEMTKLLRDQARELKVLYVEDEEHLRTSVLELLNNFFMHIDVALDGQDGLAKYRDFKNANEKPYDLVITDVNMPNMNGADMLEAIYKIVPRQLALVISAHNDSENLLRLIKLKVKYFILKPIVHKQIIEVLFNVCKEINDTALLEKYYQDVEELSGGLTDRIAELESLNSSYKKRIEELEAQINKPISKPKAKDEKKVVTQVQTSRQRNLQCTKEDQVDAHVFTETLDDYVLDRMENLLEEIDQMVIDIHSLAELPLAESRSAMKKINEGFIDFTRTVDSLVVFPVIVEAFSSFSQFLDTLDMQQVEENAQKAILITKLLGVSKDIERWINNIFMRKTADNVHYFDASFVNNCLDVKNVLKKIEIKSDEDDVEFVI